MNNVADGRAAPEGVSEQSEWRRAWSVVLAATLASSTGYTFFLLTANLFIMPMHNDFGWSLTALSIGPIVGLVVALLNPLTGVIVDHVGGRRTALIGLAMMILCYLSLAALPPNIPIFYALVAFIAVTSTICNVIVFSRSVSGWFDKHLGTALGITSAGAPLMTIVAVPLISGVITAFGWRSGYLVLAGIVTIVYPLVWFFLRDAPPKIIVVSDERSDNSGSIHVPAGATVSEAMKDTRFWMLGMSLAFTAFAFGGFMGQFSPLLAERKISSTATAAILIIYALVGGGSRVIEGMLFDRFHPPTVLAISLTASACSVFLFAAMPSGPYTVYLAGIAALGIGLAQGADASAIAFFTVRLYGMRSYSRLFGILALMTGLSLALGGLAFAQFADRTGSYNLGIMSAGFSLVAAALLMAFLPWRKESTLARPASFKK